MALQKHLPARNILKFIHFWHPCLVILNNNNNINNNNNNNNNNSLPPFRTGYFHYRYCYNSIGSYFPEVCAFTFIFMPTAVLMVTICQNPKLHPQTNDTYQDLGCCWQWFIVDNDHYCMNYEKSEEAELACARKSAHLCVSHT